MKKLISITAALAIILTFAGCGAANSTEPEVNIAADTGSITIFDDEAGGTAETAAAGVSSTTGIPSATIAAEGATADITVADGGLFEKSDYALEGGALSESYVGAAGGGVSGGTADLDIAPSDRVEGDISYDDDCDIAADVAFEEWTDDYEIAEECPIDDYYLQPQAGMLTGGEWRDNDNWSYWNNLYQNQQDWNSYKSAWNITKTNRIAVNVVTDDNMPVENATVTFNGWTSKTDNKGRAYLFYEYGADTSSLDITASYGGETKQVKADSDNITIGFSSAEKVSKSLDLMFVVDTTGSMGDELRFLQTELENVVETVEKANSNLPARVSVNFYRDEGDEYVVRPFEFTNDISLAVNNIAAQSSDGGGDFEEAVEQALDDAINKHSWSENSTKLMFLVLDAPPHNTAEIVIKMNNLMQQAAAKGIRIIPVASSGIDKNTEYLLRCLSIYTGGTYTFLTDDSGIGGSHIEPTIGDYQVEKLNSMLIRIINSYLS
ncbi:MAG: VWA domain-containing protein [Ruminiclostridium sp.]